MPLHIIRDDIRNMRTDAIVNPSNPRLKAGSGVSEVVFETSGREKLQQYCNKIAPIKIGEAAITPPFSFPVKYIIHTAGPVYSYLEEEQSYNLLKQTYKSALNLAEQNGCKSIAFPLLSSGVYKFPKDIALKAAREAIEEFLKNSDLNVYLLVFDKKSFQVSKELIGAVKSYIDENYATEHYKPTEASLFKKSRFLDSHESVSASILKDEDIMLEATSRFEDDSLLSESLTDEETVIIGQDDLTDKYEADFALEPQASQNIFDNLNDYLEEPFAVALMKLIDKTGKTDAEVYKGANIDRKLFSKIRSIKDYTPNKTTILALAVSLELTLVETEDLLKRAGYALSHSNKFDVIIEFFIKQNKYNIFEINEVLFSFDQPLLGSKSISAYS